MTQTPEPTVRIQQKAFGARRWGTVEWRCPASEAQARIAQFERDYPLCSFRIGKPFTRKKRPAREWF